MKQTQLKRRYYHLRHNYLTTNNMVMVVALLIAASWAWGSVNVLERNYNLQKELDAKERELTLVELQTDTLKFEQNYYKSDEYKELRAREDLGLALPGEKALVLPTNSAEVIAAGQKKTTVRIATSEPSNFQAWVDFLFGNSSKRL